MTKQSLREQLAYVSQQPYLFEGTIRDNIRYGHPEASDQEVERAARLAYAHEFILAQPQGYDTPVGENGVTLSGGQRQRLSIARALVRNAPILLLDEATSDSIRNRKPLFRRRSMKPWWAVQWSSLPIGCRLSLAPTRSSSCRMAGLWKTAITTAFPKRDTLYARLRVLVMLTDDRSGY